MVCDIQESNGCCGRRRSVPGFLLGEHTGCCVGGSRDPAVWVLKSHLLFVSDDGAVAQRGQTFGIWSHHTVVRSRSRTRAVARLQSQVLIVFMFNHSALRPFQRREASDAPNWAWVLEGACRNLAWTARFRSTSLVMAGENQHEEQNFGDQKAEQERKYFKPGDSELIHLGEK